MLIPLSSCSLLHSLGLYQHPDVHNGVSRAVCVAFRTERTMSSPPVPLALLTPLSSSPIFRLVWPRLINWPDVLRKARAEIDEVCDEETMPTFADWDRLRYIRMGMSLVGAS